MARIYFTGLAAAILGLGMAVAGAPAPPSVVPAAGAGAAKAFTFLFPGADVAMAEGLISRGATATLSNACYFAVTDEQFWLRDDANGAWKGPAKAGSSQVLSNSQCNLAAYGSTVTRTGDGVAVTVTFTFGFGFLGPKRVYARSTTHDGFSSDAAAGSFTVLPLTPSPDVVTSTCDEPSKDDRYRLDVVYEQSGRVMTYYIRPDCFPRYKIPAPMEGFFTENDLPIPIMGRTCGHFNVLVAFSAARTRASSRSSPT